MNFHIPISSFKLGYDTCVCVRSVVRIVQFYGYFNVSNQFDITGSPDSWVQDNTFKVSDSFNTLIQIYGVMYIALQNECKATKW